MSSRYWIFQRKGVFYHEDTFSRKQFSLRTRDRQEAETLLAAKQEAARQPQLNLQMARVYLSATDPAAVERTWRDVIDMILENKKGETLRRWLVAAKDEGLDVQSRREVVLGAMMCQNRRTYGTSITRVRPHDGGSASGDPI